VPALSLGRSLDLVGLFPPLESRMPRSIAARMDFRRQAWREIFETRSSSAGRVSEQPRIMTVRVDCHIPRESSFLRSVREKILCTDRFAKALERDTLRWVRD
jgi:hypothetical protein